MPPSRTRRPVKLRASRLASLAIAFAVALPFVQPSAAAGVISSPRLKGSGTVEDAFQVRFRPGVSAQDASAILARAHAVELSRVDRSRVRLVTLPLVGRAAVRQQLLSDPRVQSVETDAIVVDDGHTD